MQRDIWAISAGMLAIGAIFWALHGNPKSAPRSGEALNADASLKLVNQRSPYMRDER
jgi:hypothetical protein